ncbi:MAG TPA: hypothetical protein VGD87_02900, partial [Archangium sp.]
MKTLLALCACLMVVSAVGCSSTTERCNPGACQGCCDASGACVGGATQFACGSGGAVCQSCLLDQTCTLGRCVSGSTATGGGAGT